MLSCGPNHNKTFREAYLQCLPSKSKSKLQSVRKRIERCYTERLIYNELYINEQLSFPGNEEWESPLLPTMMSNNERPKQDKGHQHWLNETQKDFQSCFPNYDIKVTLENYIGLFPTKITISRYFKDRLTSTETYIKQTSTLPITRYLSVLDCYRQTKKVNQIKFQRFEKKSEWITVESVNIPPTNMSTSPQSEYQLLL
jgi:hypothetical protein